MTRSSSGNTDGDGAHNQTMHCWPATGKSPPRIWPDRDAWEAGWPNAVLAAQSGATLAELMGRLGHSTPPAAMRQDGVDAAGCPGQLVFQHGVGARVGLAHALLDVGQRAHGERQAIGQIGAVAVAQ